MNIDNLTNTNIIVKVSSENADKVTSDSNTNFNCKLKRTINNIIGVKLLDYTIPFTWHVLNKKNNLLTWTSKSSESIEVGGNRSFNIENLDASDLSYEIMADANEILQQDLHLLDQQTEAVIDSANEVINNTSNYTSQFCNTEPHKYYANIPPGTYETEALMELVTNLMTETEFDHYIIGSWEVKQTFSDRISKIKIGKNKKLSKKKRAQIFDIEFFEWKNSEHQSKDNIIYNYVLHKTIHNHVEEEIFTKYFSQGPGFIFWYNETWEHWNQNFRNLFELDNFIDSSLLARGKFSPFTDVGTDNNFGKIFLEKNDIGELVFKKSDSVVTYCIDSDYENQSSFYMIWKLETDNYMYLFWWNNDTKIWQIGRTQKLSKYSDTIFIGNTLIKVGITQVYPRQHGEWIDPFKDEMKKYNIIGQYRSPPEINKPWALSVSGHSNKIENEHENILRKNHKITSEPVKNEKYLLKCIPNKNGKLEPENILFKSIDKIEYTCFDFDKKCQNNDELLRYPIKYINKYNPTTNKLRIECRWNEILEPPMTLPLPMFYFNRTLLSYRMKKCLGLDKFNIRETTMKFTHTNTVNSDSFDTKVTNVENIIEKHFDKTEINVDITSSQTSNKTFTTKILHRNYKTYDDEITESIEDSIELFDSFLNLQIDGDSVTDINSDSKYSICVVGDFCPESLGSKMIYIDTDFHENRIGLTFENSLNTSSFSDNKINIPVDVEYKQTLRKKGVYQPTYYFFEPMTITNIFINLKNSDSDRNVGDTCGLFTYFTFEFITKKEEKDVSVVVKNPMSKFNFPGMGPNMPF